MRVPTWATGAAVVVVLSVWTATLVADFMVPDYDPPPGIEPLMMALAAFLFASRSPNELDESDESDEPGELEG